VQALCPGYTVTGFHDVTGFRRERIPGWMWLDAARVAEESLEGLAKGRLYVIPGRRYRLFAFLLRRMPRPLRDAVAIRMKKSR
jgi:short-subunit dehydrogenase